MSRAAPDGGLGGAPSRHWPPVSRSTRGAPQELPTAHVPAGLAATPSSWLLAQPAGSGLPAVAHALVGGSTATPCRKLRAALPVPAGFGLRTWIQSLPVQ